MAGLDMHYEALERCRTAVNRAFRQYGESGEDYPPKGGTSSTIFGRLTDSAGLAGSVEGVDKILNTEFGKVKSNLMAAERALSDVQDNIRRVEKA